MLKKKLIAAAVLTAGSIGVAHAGYIETTFTGGLTTQVSGATVFDFDSGAKPSGYSGDGWVLPGTAPGGTAAAPAGDTTPFLSVAYAKPVGYETFTRPGNSYNYFGLYWGSIDGYNSLSFYNDGSLLATITGLDVIQSGTALGDQIAAGANRYVNFTFHDLQFDKIVFGSTNYAFESDNHAFANVSVPEPGMVTLMGAGLLGLAFFRRRRTAASIR
jgi:hypothetical protein